MDQQRRQPRFQSKAKIRWQRAMDELLIDAIFGATCRRDEALVPIPVPVQLRGPAQPGDLRAMSSR